MIAIFSFDGLEILVYLSPLKQSGRLAQLV